jgi:protein SCO1/2
MTKLIFNWLAINLLTISLFSVSARVSRAHEGHMHTELAKAANSTDSLYNLNSDWKTQDGKAINLSEFRGKVLIVAMVYTSCKEACPMIVEDMKRIEKDLPISVAKIANFILFSFDTTRDTPEQLKAFASKRKLSSEHWTLLNGDKSTVQNLAAVLGVKYKEDDKGNFDHSNVITLLDQTGVIRFQQLGLNQNPKEFLNKARSLIEKN